MDMVDMEQDPFAVSSGGGRSVEILPASSHFGPPCPLASAAGIRNFSPADTKIGHLAV